LPAEEKISVQNQKETKSYGIVPPKAEEVLQPKPETEVQATEVEDEPNQEAKK